VVAKRERNVPDGNYRFRIIPILPGFAAPEIPLNAGSLSPYHRLFVFIPIIFIFANSIAAAEQPPSFVSAAIAIKG